MLFDKLTAISADVAVTAMAGAEVAQDLGETLVEAQIFGI